MVHPLDQLLPGLPLEPVRDAPIQMLRLAADPDHRKKLLVQTHADPSVWIIDNHVIDTLIRNFHSRCESFAAHGVCQLAGNPVDSLMREFDGVRQRPFGWRGDMDFPSDGIDFQNQSLGPAIDARDERRRACANIDFRSGGVIYRHIWDTFINLILTGF